jgi:hypothetical protein
VVDVDRILTGLGADSATRSGLLDLARLANTEYHDIRASVRRGCAEGPSPATTHDGQDSRAQDGQSGRQANRATAEALWLGQIPADHWELVQRRGKDLVLQSRITRQDEAQDCRNQQQQSGDETYVRVMILL